MKRSEVELFWARWCEAKLENCRSSKEEQYKQLIESHLNTAVILKKEGK